MKVMNVITDKVMMDGEIMVSRPIYFQGSYVSQ